MTLHWSDYYRERLVSPQEAVGHVRATDRVLMSAGRQPQALGFALAARGKELTGIEICLNVPDIDFGWYAEGAEQIFRIKSSYIVPRGVAREWMDSKRGDYQVPNVIHINKERGHSDRVDVVLIEISPPDEHGYCSFGTSVWNMKALVKSARLVLAEVNPRSIRTYGDNFVHVSEISYFVDHQRTKGTSLGISAKASNTHLPAILEQVAQLVRDGDTVQIGAGSTSEPLVQMGLFDQRADLGLHTEMTARGMVKLVRAGVINGRKKTLHPGKAIATAVGGDREDMEYLQNNPQFELLPSTYVNHPAVIAQNANMVAINNALMVDLSGQVTAESLGPRMISGPGGQPAYAIGAYYSRGGRSVTVLPATAADGAVSRIVPQLPQGTIVTVPRDYVNFVVTEYGTAQLQGKGPRQRAEALIEIAHPDFRPQLRADLVACQYL